MQDRQRRCFQFEAAYSTRIIGVASVANGKGDAKLQFDVKSNTGKVIYSSDRGSTGKGDKFSFNTPKYNSNNDVYDDEYYDYDEEELSAKYDVCLFLTFHATQHVADAKRSIEFWIRPESEMATLGEVPNAREHDLSALSVSMRDIQHSLKTMTGDLASLQQRERRLAKRIAFTAHRLTLMATLSILVLVATAVLQVMHFKTFFKSKKLI